MVEFTIPTRPRPKQRPRVGRYGNVYTPQQTKDYEDMVALYARQAGAKLTEEPIAIEATFYFKDKRIPDLDNCAKALLDGLQEIVYKNDKQVVEQHFFLDYSEDQRTEVKIWKKGKEQETCVNS